MNSRIKTIFLLFLSVFLISGAAFGAVRYLLVAPGESFTGAGAKTGAPNPQIAGFPFNLMVDSVYDTSWAYVNTLENTNLTATQASTFNPTVPFLLSENNTAPAVSSCKRSVTITVDNAVSGNVIFYATPVVSGGTAYNSVTISVQKINDFLFSPITSPQTAGTSIAYTLTARQPGGATATGFSGSAASVTISAYYTLQNVTVTSVVTTFTNGVASGNITLYDATEGAQRVTLTASVTLPTGLPLGLSTNFAVNPAAVTKLLIIGPGQSMNPGINGGNGRTGSPAAISETTDTVAAGVTFTVTVYAVDAYWNTVTGATGTVTLASADPLSTTPAATALVSGKAILTVKMGTVSAATALTVTSSSGYTQDSDLIPVTHGAVDHFDFTSVIPAAVTANQLFTFSAVAHDVYNNVVTDFSSNVVLDALKGGSTVLTGSHWYRSPLSPAFSGGYLTSFQIRIYERISSCTLRITYNSASGTSTPFAVNPAAFTKLLLLAPGETFDPGAGFPIDNGKSGVANQANAGSSVPFTVYGTDAYSNIVTSAGDTYSITSSDAGGLANNVTPPVQVALAGGVGSFNFSFANAGAQGVYCNDVTNGAIFPSSVTLTVQGGSISYFDFSNMNSPLTTGNWTHPLVTARDSFGNAISSYNGNAWVTSPDTDWTLPSETTINVSQTAGTLYGSAWYVTFTAGTATLDMYFRRSGSARIFICDDAAGTTYNAVGHRGLSNAVTVNTGSIVKQMQIVPPGMTARAGTIDGIDGTPSGHIAVVDVFTVTVNACDGFWNIITTGTGATDTIQLTTSDNSNARAARNGQTRVMPPVSTGLTAGTVLMDVAYLQDQTNFIITVSDLSRGSIATHSTPPINIFNVDHFRIVGDTPLVDRVAGVPFTITITAENSSFTRITSFDGAVVQLKDSLQAPGTEYYTLWPRQSVTFTAGVAIMQVTMYAAHTTWTSGATIDVYFGSIKSSSVQFNIWWGAPKYIITRVPGRVYMPGLTAPGLDLPDYKNGCIGTSLVQEAGVPFQLEIIYADANYNRILTLPQTYCKITSSDPLATLGTAPEMSLAASNVYVTITAGTFSSTYMKLRTVGATRSQTIYSAPTTGSWTALDSGDIVLRHTTHDHFGISAPSASQVAGVYFNITIQALDAFQNICDSENGGLPFNNSVNLLPSTLANTMYPYLYTLSNGQAVASVALFKAPDSNVTIQASYGPITGSSNVIQTIPNEFKRLLITDSGYGGMTLVNGKFTGAVPADGAFPMITGSPFALDPTQATVSWQDAASAPLYPHYGKLHQFTVYACDAYGNYPGSTTELSGNTVTVTFNDAYGQPITPTTINAINGYTDFMAIFHTAKAGMHLTAHTTQSGILDYITPDFTTLAGPAYGLQLIVPGIDAVEGSGRTLGAFSSWYNGVTGIPSSQYTTNPFPVTVQSADIYGNFKNGTYNNFRVYTNALTYINAYPASFPTQGNDYSGSLVDGIKSFTAYYDVTQARDVDLQPQDLSAAGPSNLNRVVVLVPNAVPIVMSGNLEYQIIVNGVDYGQYGTNSVTAVVLPDNFALTVNVVDSVSKKPVYGINAMFRLVPVFATDIYTATGVTLSVPLGGTGNVSNGVYTTILEGYSRADLIRIRVEDPNTVPVVTTGPKYSCIIDFGANSLSANMTVTAVPASIGSGHTSQIRALVRDTSGNLVVGREVEFQFMDTDPESTATGAFGPGTPLLITRTVTDLSGVATANFIGGYLKNGKCKIIARYFGAGAPQERTVFVNVSLVDPNESKISNYPNPFKAGAENTNISFYVEDPVDVKIKIYNIMGQIVLEKTYTLLEVANLISTNGNMLTYVWDGRNSKGKIVGNGGYIAFVEAGEAKYKRKIAVRK